MPSKKLQDVKSRWDACVWQGDTRSMPWWKSFIVNTLRIGQAVVRDLAEGQLSLRAMSLVYTTVISLVPLLAISFSVLKGFGAHNQIRPMLQNALEPLGDKGTEITEKIIQFVDNIQVGVLGALGLALLIYSVVSMMQKIERSFNYTWHISRGRSFAQRFSDYLSVLLVGPLLIFLSVGITTSFRTNFVVEKLSGMPVMGDLIESVGLTVPYFLMAAAFAFIYAFMPNTKVKASSAFIGGLVTAVVWKTMGIVFTAFVANSANHTAIYSAFASVIIFMVWLYLAWLVLLVGASIAFYHQNPQYIRIRKDALRLSNRVRERLGLSIVYLIARHFNEEKTPWTIHALSEHLAVPDAVVERLVGALETAGYISAAGEDKPRNWLPAKPLDHIRIRDVIAAVRSTDEDGMIQEGRIPAEKPVDQYFKEVNQLLDSKLGKLTLADWV